MRCVIQRVQHASVMVRGATTGRIDLGLLAYVGVAPTDGLDQVRFLAAKALDLRVFPDHEGKMNLSLRDLHKARDRDAAEPGILVVSQFTLFGDVRKGRRPSYNGAATPEHARRTYDALLAELGRSGIRVQSGVFQEHMDVTYTNDGPVTILIDTDSVWSKTR